jgi:hypothetical protein
MRTHATLLLLSVCGQRTSCQTLGMLSIRPAYHYIRRATLVTCTRRPTTGSLLVMHHCCHIPCDYIPMHIDGAAWRQAPPWQLLYGLAPYIRHWLVMPPITKEVARLVVPIRVDCGVVASDLQQCSPQSETRVMQIIWALGHSARLLGSRLIKTHMVSSSAPPPPPRPSLHPHCQTHL